MTEEGPSVMSVYLTKTKRLARCAPGRGSYAFPLPGYPPHVVDVGHLVRAVVASRGRSLESSVTPLAVHNVIDELLMSSDARTLTKWDRIAACMKASL